MTRPAVRSEPVRAHGSAPDEIQGSAGRRTEHARSDNTRVNAVVVPVSGEWSGENGRPKNQGVSWFFAHGHVDVSYAAGSQYLAPKIPLNVVAKVRIRRVRPVRDESHRSVAGRL